MSNNRGQPSVLLLLPFSNNKFGTQSDDTEKNEILPRKFPILAVTRTKKDARSKSATSHDVTATQHSLRLRKRFLRASSERLSRGQTLGPENKPLKYRAKSEYSINVSPRAKPDTAGVYVNDINEQTVNRHFVQLDSFPTPRLHLRSPGRLSHNKITTLHKPVLRSAHRPTPQLNYGQENSLETSLDLLRANPSPGEREPCKFSAAPTRAASPDEAPQKPTRLKLNVNELPRSKTPIAENDPDKLNINHVIAFLETSGQDLGNGESQQENQSAEISGANTQKTFPNNDSSVNEWNHRVQNGQRNVLITPDSVNLVNNASQHSLPHGKVHKVTPHRHAQIRPKSYAPGAVERKDCQENPRERSGKIGDKESSPDQSDQVERRSKSHLMSSASPRDHKPRNETPRRGRVDNRPFRLHRFLTQVTGDPSCVHKQAGDELDRVTFSATEGSFSPILHSRSESHPTNPLTGEEMSRLSNVDSDKTFNTTRLETFHFLSRFNVSKQPMLRLPEVGRQGTARGRDNIICLPTAHFEPDSDEEGLPPMPINSNKTVTSTEDHEKVKLSSQDRILALKTTGIGKDEAIGRSKTSLNLTNNRMTHSSSKRPSSEKTPQTVPAPLLQSHFSERHTNFQGSNPHASNDMTSLLPDNDFYNGDPRWTCNVSISTQQVLSYVTPSSSQLHRDHETAFRSQLGPASPKVITSDTNSREHSTLLYRFEKIGNFREFPQEHIKLTLRKERDRTSGLTYMTDMQGSLES